MEALPKPAVAVLVVALDGRFPYGAVHPLDLAVGFRKEGAEARACGRSHAVFIRLIFETHDA